MLHSPGLTWFLILSQIAFQTMGFLMCFLWLRNIHAVKVGFPLLLAFLIALAVRVYDLNTDIYSHHGYWMKHPGRHMAIVGIYAAYFAGFVGLYAQNVSRTIALNLCLREHIMADK